MAVTLRDYDNEDFQTLFEIDQACYPPGIAYSKRTLRWFLALPEAECIVAGIGGDIAGFILTEAVTPPSWRQLGRQDPSAPLRTSAGDTTQGIRGHIITLDVLEQFRRRRVGSALLAEAERRRAARGIEIVNLETAVTNEPAIAFWKKHGYRTGGVLKRYYLGRVDAYWMEKVIGR